MPAALDYERQANEHGIRIDRLEDGGVEIVIGTHRHHFAAIFAHSMKPVQNSLLYLLLWPFVFVFYLLLTSRKPRGIIRIDRNEVYVEDRPDIGLGWRADECVSPRKEVTAFGANRFLATFRFASGTSENFEFMCHLPEEVIEHLACIINDALHQLRDADQSAALRNPP